VSLLVGAAGAVADDLLDLFVVLLAAKAGDEIFKRIGQPAIVGEILAGVVVGPSALAIVEPGEALEVFAELGVVFLLFWVGLETHVADLRAVGRAALLTGVLGAVLPFGAGVGLGFGLGEGTGASVFLGAALVATSVGITSAVLVELGALELRASRVILGAAVVDDVVAMIVLAVASGLAVEGAIQADDIVLTLTLAVAFVAFFALGGTTFMRKRPQILKAPRFSESPLLPAVILCLGLAALSAQIGLAAIIGAFLAGMMVAETKEVHPIEDEVAPLYAFFPPFFFASIGIQLDLGVLADGGTLALLAGVTVLAAATKLVGAWLGARSLGRANAAFVAVGMVPRGEVGIIVAGIGGAAGVVGGELFAVVVAMSVATTLAVPPVLRILGRPLRA
jgi:Kef-type K+ transport system membrane component KefB